MFYSCPSHLIFTHLLIRWHAKLAGLCPAPLGGPVPKHAPYRKQARLAAKSMHPSRPGTALTLVAPLGGERRGPLQEDPGHATAAPGVAKRRADADLTRVQTARRKWVGGGGTPDRVDEEATAGPDEGGVLG